MLLVVLLWSLIEVHSLPFSYASFGPNNSHTLMGKRSNGSAGVHLSLNGSVIPNHGYVEISGIGTAGDDTALLCHTNRR